jgi:hypothetical protein
VFTNQFATFFNNGDTSSLVVIDPAQFMQSTNLHTSGLDGPVPTGANGTNVPGATGQGTLPQQMITFTLNPFPNVDPGLASRISGGTTTPADQETIVNNLIANAIVSVSVNAFSDIVARRLPGPNSPASMMDIMDMYSTQRFTNPAWYGQIASASDTALLRELAHMQAYNIWLQYQQFRVQEQQTALLATMNSVLAKMNNSLNALNAQMANAAAQAASAQASAAAAASQTCSAGQTNYGAGCVTTIPSSSSTSSSGNS